MGVRRHLKAHDVAILYVDHDALDTEDQAVARQGVFPRVELRMADVGRCKVHLTDAPAVMLERRNPLRVGRPQKHGLVASAPPRVVSCVSEILDTVRRQLFLPAALKITYPQVVIPHERGSLAVRRSDRGSVGGRRTGIQLCARVRLKVASVRAAPYVEADRLLVFREGKLTERQRSLSVSRVRNG